MGLSPHLWLFKALWIKACPIWYTILPNQVNQVNSILLATLIKRSLKLIVWFTSAADNHNMKPQNWQQEQSSGPANTFTTNYQTATPSLPLHAASRINVFWIPDSVINTFSIFSPSGAPPTSKERKRMVWYLWVPEPSAVSKSPRRSAPRHRRGAAEEMWFHEHHAVVPGR